MRTDSGSGVDFVRLDAGLEPQAGASVAAGNRRLRRKYEFTPTIDAKLHEIYRHPDRRTHLTVKRYA